MKSIIAIYKGGGATGGRAHSLREEARHLWTRLESDLTDARPSELRLAVCATRSREGATTVAANFAIFLGEQGRKCCLVETNFRDPTLAQHFLLPAGPGLGDYLDETCTLDEIIRHEVSPGVSLVAAGSAPANAFLSVGNGTMSKLLQDLEEEHDVLIFDVPPLSTSPEAALVLRHADAAVIVVEANRTRSPAVARSIATLQDLGVPIAGAVLNRMTYDIPALVERLV